MALALATERTAEPRTIARDPEAIELFLRGRYLMNRGWFEAGRQGADLLREAHRRLPDDPRIAGTYALAVARLLTTERDREGIAAANMARELAERTLEKDSSQAEARVALAFLHVNESEGAAAALQFRKALSVAPNAVEALDGIGRMLVEIGRSALGVATLRRALAIDPLMSHPKQSLARTYALLGERRRAAEELGPMPEDPADFVAHALLQARFALWFGERDAADGLARGLARATGLSSYARESMEGLLHFLKVPEVTREQAAMLDAALPIAEAFAPRRLAFHAQIRAEIKLAGGAIEAGLSDLQASDANGLIDLFWLDRCPPRARLAWRRSSIPPRRRLRPASSGRRLCWTPGGRRGMLSLMRLRHVLGSLALAALLPLTLAAEGCSGSSSSGPGASDTDAATGSTTDGGTGKSDSAPAADGAPAPPANDCKLAGLTGVADVTPAFLFDDPPATAPPAMTGGTLKGKYTVDKATVYLPTQTKGLADPTKSTGTVNAWAVFDGTNYLLNLNASFTISSVAGEQKQGSSVTSQGGFTVAGAALTLDHACDTKPADESEYTFTESGNGRAQILIKTSTTFGATYLLLDASKM